MYEARNTHNGVETHSYFYTEQYGDGSTRGSVGMPVEEVAATLRVPSFSAWLEKQDQRPAYETLRALLQQPGMGRHPIDLGKAPQQLHQRFDFRRRTAPVFL